MFGKKNAEKTVGQITSAAATITTISGLWELPIEVPVLSLGDGSSVTGHQTIDGLQVWVKKTENGLWVAGSDPNWTPDVKVFIHNGSTIAPVKPESAESTFKRVKSSPTAAFQLLFSGVTTVVQCRICAETPSKHQKPVYTGQVLMLIQHLNDEHLLSRTQVADELDLLEIDFSQQLSTQEVAAALRTPSMRPVPDTYVLASDAMAGVSGHFSFEGASKVVLYSEAYVTTDPETKYRVSWVANYVSVHPSPPNGIVVTKPSKDGSSIERRIALAACFSALHPV